MNIDAEGENSIASLNLQRCLQKAGDDLEMEDFEQYINRLKVVEEQVQEEPLPEPGPETCEECFEAFLTEEQIEVFVTGRK
jgi:hypothetical protein